MSDHTSHKIDLFREWLNIKYGSWKPQWEEPLEMIVTDLRAMAKQDREHGETRD